MTALSRLRLLLLASLILLPGLAQAADLTISNAWSRASIGAGTTGAVFMEIVNPGAETVVLTGASTQAAATAELHTHRMDGDVMQMRQVPSVEIPAGGALAFQPGGHHVMLFGLTRKLAEGESFQLVLESNAGESFPVTVTVMSPGFMGHENMGQGGMGHGTMNHGGQMMQPSN
ncbi:MAG: copper chaperone PCu(A)C [Limibacillus sp.]|jgi:copper(I)-binding protein